MTILTVKKTIITLGNIQVDAYSADEISSTTGAPINYLSGQGLAASIDLHDTTTLQKRLSKELKAMLGEGFTTLQGRYVNSSNAVSKVTLWNTLDATKYYLYHALNRNEKAESIMLALASTTLDIIINDNLGRDYQKGQAQKWIEFRLMGKVTRRKLTDAIRDWYLRNPDGTSCPAPIMYALTTNNIYKALWAMDAKQIELVLGCDRNESRDNMTSDCLMVLERAEDRVIDFIDFDNIKPKDAVEVAQLKPSRIKLT